MLGRNWPPIAGSIVLIFAHVTCGQEPAVATRPQPTAAEMEAWVQQLNADDYALREEAAARLVEAGSAAIEALVKGAVSDQAEVAWRSSAALEQIAVEGDEKTIDLIVKQLNAAGAKSGKHGLSALTGDLVSRQKQFRRERAISQIRKHGGRIAGMGIDGGIDEMGMGMAPLVGPVMVFDGPAIAVAEAIEAVPVPLDEPVAEEPALGIFGGLAKAIARALVPDAEPVEAPVIPLAEPALPLPTVEEAPEVKPAEVEPAEGARVEPTAEGAPPADAEGSKPPVVEEAAEAAVAEVAVAEVAFADAMVAVDIGGGMMVEGGWAQLALDHHWRGGDEGLSALADLPDLNQVEIRGAKISDKALEHLTKLPRLSSLDIYRSPFSRDALLKFHRQRPGVMVYARGEAMMGVNADLGSSPLILSSIYEPSGASEAGLQVGDAIHEIDGVKIRDFSDLTICISAKKPGDQVDVVYQRGGKKRTAKVTLKKRTVDQ